MRAKRFTYTLKQSLLPSRVWVFILERRNTFGSFAAQMERKSSSK